jgi:hypothetical protein
MAAVWNGPMVADPHLAEAALLAFAKVWWAHEVAQAAAATFDQRCPGPTAPARGRRDEALSGSGSQRARSASPRPRGSGASGPADGLPPMPPSAAMGGYRAALTPPSRPANRTAMASECSM